MSFQTVVTERLAAITEMLNAISTNAKKIFELPWQSTLNTASEIQVSIGGTSQRINLQQIVDAILSYRQNQLLSASISILVNDVTIASGAQWIINNVNYQLVGDAEFNIPYAEIGYTRNDILVADIDNNIYKIVGPETAGVSPTPATPLNTVLVTVISVTDSTILNSDPEFGTDFELLVNKQNSLDIDGSAIKYPTVDAVNSGLSTLKAYADSLVVGLLDYRGIYDASINLFPTTGGSGASGAVLKGDLWVVSVAGTLAGKAVTIGDSFMAVVDSPGQTSANWGVLETNIGYVPENSANKTGTVSGNEASTTLYLHIAGAIAYFQQKLTDANFGTLISGFTTKATMADSDGMPHFDSGDSNKAKIISWLSFKSLFKTVGGQSVFGTGDIEAGGTKRTARWWAVGSGGGMSQQGALIDYILILTGSKIPQATITYNNLLTSIARLVYRSPATAGSSCGIATGKDNVRPFSSKSGIDLILKFDTSDAAAVGTSRIAAGINSLNADIGNINPSSLVSTILVGNDTGDSNLFLMHNDSSGTCAKIDLGSNFPHNTPNCFYELLIKTKPGTAVYAVTINRYDNANPSDVPAFTYSTVLSTDVPNTQLSWFLSRNNGATAASVEVGISYVENKFFY